MRLSGCSKLSLHPLTGCWFRALNLKHWRTRLFADHSKIHRSRFSAATLQSPGPRVLYLGETHQVSIYEVGALLGDPTAPIANPAGAWVLMNVLVRLHRVADLSDPRQQRLIGTNPQELTGVWAGARGAAPTQKLGAALFDVPELEGFVFPSAKTGGRNLAVFMDKLSADSRLSFENQIDGESKWERLA